MPLALPPVPPIVSADVIVRFEIFTLPEFTKNTRETLLPLIISLSAPVPLILTLTLMVGSDEPRTFVVFAAAPTKLMLCVPGPALFASLMACRKLPSPKSRGLFTSKSSAKAEEPVSSNPAVKIERIERLQETGRMFISRPTNER